MKTFRCFFESLYYCLSGYG